MSMRKSLACALFAASSFLLTARTHSHTPKCRHARMIAPMNACARRRHRFASLAKHGSAVPPRCVTAHFQTIAGCTCKLTDSLSFTTRWCLTAHTALAVSVMRQACIRA
eukprot:6199534-Pleurochrysis_carterae.AAC.1